MNNSKGFTLIELLITMAIMVAVIAMTGPIYTILLTGVKDSTIKNQSSQELVRSLELIRLDLEHVGLGIARDETPMAGQVTMPIEWTEGTQTLTLHSTLNNTNQTTMGWAILDCDVTNESIVASTYIVNLKETPNLQSMVILDESKNFSRLAEPASGTITFDCPTSTNTDCAMSFNCPTSVGIYTAYPFDADVANGCSAGYCNRLTYVPSAANGVPTKKGSCAQGTFNLVRRVGTSGTGGDTIVNCVADFRVRFDIDANNNDIIEAGEEEQNVIPAAYNNAGLVMDRVKNIEFLILVQAGQFDEDINTNPNTTVSGVTLSLGNVTNATNYRWKTIKVSAKPMSW